MKSLFPLLPLLLFPALPACENGDGAALVGTLERDRVTLIAERSEPVIERFVEEGARLQAGDRILALDARRAVAERERLAAQRTQAARRVDELVRGPREEAIREARAALEGANAALENARLEFERISELANERLASTAQRDAATVARARALAERDAARAALDALLEGTTVEELDQARAALQALDAALREQDVVIERLDVRAPRAGYVEALPHELGSQPPQGATVAVLLADGAPHARVHVPNARRAQFTTGREVRVRVPGAGEFQGRVRWVSAEAAFTPYYALTEHDRDRLSYAAEVELRGDGVESLPAGVPVEVFAAE